MRKLSAWISVPQVLRRGAGVADAAGSGDGEDGDGGELAAAKVESGECCIVDGRCRCCPVI